MKIVEGANYSLSQQNAQRARGRGARGRPGNVWQTIPVFFIKILVKTRKELRDKVIKCQINLVSKTC